MKKDMGKVLSLAQNSFISTSTRQMKRNREHTCLLFYKKHDFKKHEVQIAEILRNI